MGLDERTSRFENLSPAISLKSRKPVITRYPAEANVVHCSECRRPTHADARLPSGGRLCDFFTLGVIAGSRAAALVLANSCEFGISTEATVARFVKADFAGADDGRK